MIENHGLFKRILQSLKDNGAATAQDLCDEFVDVPIHNIKCSLWWLVNDDHRRVKVVGAVRQADTRGRASPIYDLAAPPEQVPVRRLGRRPDSL